MKALTLATAIALASLLSLSAMAESEQEIMAAAKAVASGSATGTQKAIAFKNNKTINYLAMSGAIDNETYQKNQAVFEDVNHSICENAAKENGLIAGSQKKTSNEFKPGTDTDKQISSAKGALSADDVAKARKSYNDKVNEYLKSNGVDAEGEVNWAKRLDTDLMPNPDQMSDGEFAKAADLINKDGGNMYHSKDAANAEKNLRANGATTIEQSEAYAKEMGEKVAAMDEQLKRIQADKEAYPNADLEMQKLQANKAKYIQRIENVTKAIGGSSSLDGGMSETLANAQRRTADTANDAAIVGALDKHLVGKSLENYMNAISNVAKADPASSSKCQAILARMGSQMPPSSQGSFIEGLRASHGDDFAKDVVSQMKKINSEKSAAKASQASSDDAAAPSGEGTLKTLGYVGAFATATMNEYEAARKEGRGVSYGKIAFETGLAISPPGRFVNAARAVVNDISENTIAYRQQLEKRYKDLGYDMDSASVKFAIWSKATAYGTAHGVCQAGYQGVHLVPVVGDLVGAAETAAVASYETALTIKTLNECYAIRKENALEQMEQSGRSVDAGRKMLADMRTLAASASKLKEELDAMDDWAAEAGGKSLELKSAADAAISDCAEIAKELAAPNAAALIDKDSLAKLATEYNAVKAVADSSLKRAAKTLGDSEKDSFDKASAEKDFLSILSEMQLNDQRLQAANEKLAAIASLSSAQDKMREFSARQAVAAGCLKSLDSLSKSAAKMRSSYASRQKQLAEISQCFELIKGKMRAGYEYFWVKNDKGSAEWEGVWDEANSLKMAKPSGQEASKGLEFLSKIKESLESYLSQAKAPETPAGADAALDLARRGKEAIAPLIAPASAAEEAEEAARASLDKLASVFGKNQEIEVAVSVLDADGKAIFGASVKVYGQSQGGKQPAGEGGAKFRLPPGKHKAEASAEGYVSKTEILTVEPGVKGLEAAIRLAPEKSATTRVEEKQEEKATEAKPPLPKVSDEDMKKAEGVLSRARSLAGNGILPTRDNILQGRARYFLGDLSSMAGVGSQDAILTATLLLDPSNGALLDVIDAATKYGAREMAFRSCDGWNSFDGLTSIALIKNGLARELKKSPPQAKELQLASDVAEFCRKFSCGYGFDFSSLLGWKAYCEFHGRKLSPNGDSKPAAPLKFDASHWLRLVQAGGYDAVAKELDAFWASKEAKKELKDVGAFQAKWPDAAKDYRDKFIAETVIPQIKESLEASKNDAAKELASAAKRFAPLLSGATVSVSGSVSCVADPAAPLLKLSHFDPKRTIETQGTSFSNSLPIKEVDSSMRFAFEASARNIYGEFAAIELAPDVTADLNPASDAFPLGGEISCSGFSYVVKFKPVKCLAYRKWDPPFKDSDGIVKIPSYPQDRSQEYAEKLNSILSAQESGSLPAKEAQTLLAETRREFEAFKRMADKRMDDAASAASHNCSVQEKLMKDQPSAQRDAVLNPLRAQRDAISKERSQRWKSFEDVERAANERDRAYSSKLNAQGQDLYKKAQALAKTMTEPKEEERKALTELAQGLEAWLWMRQGAQSSRQWRDFPNWDPEGLDSYDDKRISEMIGKTEGRQDGPLKRALAAGEQLLAARKEALATIAEIRRYELLKKSESPLAKAGFPGQTEIVCDNLYPFQLEYDAENVVKAESLRNEELVKACANDMAKCKAYLKKRGGVVEDLEAEIQALEQAAARLPSPSAIKEANDKIRPLKDRMIPYCQAIEAAVLSGSPRGAQAPKATLDAKGSDAAFVEECVSTLKAALEASVEITGDFLPAKYKRDCFAKRYSDWNGSSKWSKASEAQQERMRKVGEKYAESAKDCGDIFMVYQLGFFEDVKDLGSKPEQRVARLLELNGKVAKELAARAGRLPSADANDIARFFGELNDWFGLMPDIPTLENLKARAAIYKEAYASGRIAECRAALGKPKAPESIGFLGQKLSLNGPCVVLRLSQLPDISPAMAKSYEKTEWAGKFKKSVVMKFFKDEEFNLEFAFGDYYAYSPWYDYNATYELPVSKEFLPLRYQLHFRNASKDGKLNSQLKNEPAISIVILP